MRYAAGCRPHSLTLSGHRALCCAPRHVTLAFPELAPRVDTRSALLDEHLAAEAARELGPGQLPSPGGQRGPRGPVSAQRAGVQERAAHACPGVSWGHGTEHRREAAQPSESAKRGRRGGSRGGAGRGRGLWREEPLEEEPQERVGEEARAGAAAETGAVRGGPSSRAHARHIGRVCHLSSPGTSLWTGTGAGLPVLAGLWTDNGLVHRERQLTLTFLLSWLSLVYREN